ncbi:MAG: alanine racemase [Patescibacteria group bacterium]
MKQFLTWLSRRRFPYTPLICISISRSRLLHNLHEFQRLAPAQTVAPVLKSNAYGHGLLEVARILERNQEAKSKERNTIPFFIIDSYFEAVALRSHGIKTPLLLIGYTPPETLLSSSLPRTSFTIGNIHTLKALSELRHPLTIHLKIDTGMHRQGILIEDIPEAILLIQANPYITLEGICTHLADSDNHDASFTHTQIQKWNECVRIFKKEFPSLKWFHASATYGHVFTQKIDANMSRLGIGLYGLAGDMQGDAHIDLRPVMHMETVISDIKKIKKGEAVGYNATFVAERDMTIATIPAGYYEAIDRRLSDVGYILVGPQRIPCKIIGRVSMNITSIDVSDVPMVSIGDTAVVISDQVNDPNSITSIVTKTPGTIAYEMVIAIPSHLKRVVG